MNGREPAERDIAMVFQNYALYPHMSVRGNMEYGLKNRGVRRDEIDRRVGEAAAILGIEPLLARRPRQLSGGQRQRVAMGRAIVRDPKVFLFDEPLSNLDAKLRVQMRIEIRRLQQRLKVTSLYVTHDQLEAMTLADVLVVMNEGRIEQIGTAIEVYERPATTFVATFIGSPPMNVLPGDTPGTDPALLGLPDGLAAADVLLGVRPEDLAIGGAPGESGLVLGFTVDGVEPLGAESLVHGTAENGAPLTVRAPGHLRHAAGARLTATVPCERLHLFARADGNRLPRAGEAARRSA